jgi:hypothetical protein
MRRFVILEHTWNGVHWDLMFECDGALRTWALERWPERDIAIEARRLPDHRIAYLDFEGPVSGDRGSVRRVEAGWYVVRSEGAEGLVVELRGSQLEAIARLEPIDLTDQNAWRFRLENVD